MEEKAPTSVMEMLSRINVFYEDGKIVPERLDAAAERMAQRVQEDPTLLRGTTLDEIFSKPEERDSE